MQPTTNQSADLEHLLPEAAQMIRQPITDRIWFTRQDKWIGHAQANAALAAMRDIMDQPHQIRRQSMLVAGRPNNGKTTILRKFTEEHPATETEGGDWRIPIVALSMPEKADESLLWSRILTAMSIPHRDNAKADVKRAQALSVIKIIRCQALLVDEIHNILLGNNSQQRQMLAVLKGLSEAAGVPLIVAGTVDAFRALKTDHQTSTRFKPFALPPWKLDREFLTLLASLEATLPLAEPSNLTSRSMAIKLFNLSNGTIGGVIDALKEATIIALREGRERIEQPILDRLDGITAADFNAAAL